MPNAVASPAAGDYDAVGLQHASGRVSNPPDGVSSGGFMVGLHGIRDRCSSSNRAAQVRIAYPSMFICKIFTNGHL